MSRQLLPIALSGVLSLVGVAVNFELADGFALGMFVMLVLERVVFPRLAHRMHLARNRSGER